MQFYYLPFLLAFVFRVFFYFVFFLFSDLRAMNDESARGKDWLYAENEEEEVRQCVKAGWMLARPRVEEYCVEFLQPLKRFDRKKIPEITTQNGAARQRAGINT